ncbi:permease for cytosine/purines, uracil, thiamine, allantoin-domain-containing protein [Hygrophoropsis aurantiaca]|uniref:Permease for cytosine/purines, uracil, thiamine, allantoin-domain-containing protein n=1 Tax=Hygrophoropsis aurantiaca TaxID=72124 RepID=A0ACB8ANX7_9AGAM|nr:permease for cytosine/purines, uracil, thiamine, allantoin-domain-containing protein [Hygrophoropsis aurantiaca]
MRTPQIAALANNLSSAMNDIEKIDIRHRDRPTSDTGSTKTDPDELSLTHTTKEPEGHKIQAWLQTINGRLDRLGVEMNEIIPIPAGHRLDTQWYKIFFLWFSANLNIIGFSTGTIGPAFFSLSATEAIVIALISDVIGCLPPAFFAVFGSKLGIRSMIQSRFSFGYWGAIAVCCLNVISLQGYVILSAIVGGQTLAGVSSRIDDTLGIVIVSLISSVVAFCGCPAIQRYQCFAWIPVSIAFIAMLVIGYPQLNANRFTSLPFGSVDDIISFASIVVSSTLSWSTITADYGIHHSPATSSTRIFIYAWLGLFIFSFTSHALGIAFAAAAPQISSWNTGFNGGSSAGGLLAAVFASFGGFGKVMTALMALSTSSVCALCMYSFGMSVMAIHPRFSTVPRWVYVLVSEAVLIPVAITGAKSFYTNLDDFLGAIGYWYSCFVAIPIVDHIAFRRNAFTEMSYPITACATSALLPRSSPGMLAFLCGCTALLPFISQAWYTGPLACIGTGDLGVFVGFIVSGAVYIVLRKLELWRGATPM